MKKIAVILFALSILPVAMVSAAPPEVQATLKPDSVMIGDRFTLEVTVRKDMMQMVELPSFQGGELVPGIEIAGESQLDTIETDGRIQTLRKKYDLTAFKAGIYQLERFPVLYGDKNIMDTLYSVKQMRILVAEPEIATEGGDIKDIKAPEKAPLMVSEISGYIILTILFLCILAALVYTIRKAIMKRSGKSEKKATQAALPPHVRAIHDLEALHNQKLWQSGRHKQYYTRLTDIIRYYLYGRFGLNAMEMTSEEIIDDVRTLPLSDKQRSELGDMLRTADLVKFAKFTPENDCNDKLYYAAYYFVENTKVIPEEPAAEEQNTQSDEK